jgi:hypothetical protein
VTLQRLKDEMNGNSHTKDVTMKTTRTHSFIAAAVLLAGGDGSRLRSQE